jgi:hypothetical protein
VYEIRDFVEFKTTWHPIGVQQRVAGICCGPDSIAA